ncbi:MAG: hypothetical protein IPK53_17650 [bacterium]|nr:hypothetical protein [bacterium]
MTLEHFISFLASDDFAKGLTVEFAAQAIRYSSLRGWAGSKRIIQTVKDKFRASSGADERLGRLDKYLSNPNDEVVRCEFEKDLQAVFDTAGAFQQQLIEAIRELTTENELVVYLRPRSHTVYGDNRFDVVENLLAEMTS